MEDAAYIQWWACMQHLILGDNVNQMKNIHSLEQKVLKMLPVKQTDVWKNLGINRRDCSALIGMMINDNLIKRSKLNKTFLLERKNVGSNKGEHYKLLSEEGSFSPCTGCRRSCEPPTCDLLIKWLM